MAEVASLSDSILSPSSSSFDLPHSLSLLPPIIGIHSHQATRLSRTCRLTPLPALLHLTLLHPTLLSPSPSSPRFLICPRAVRRTSAGYVLPEVSTQLLPNTGAARCGAVLRDPVAPQPICKRAPSKDFLAISGLYVFKDYGIDG
jgi:hypothetical protein